MNREIKFRAWDGKEMHYNVCINHEQKAIKYGYRATDWVEDANAGIPMQYTGLKDRNGKEIYEGDIVETPKGITSVTYEKACFYVKIENSFYRLGGWDFEVINIIGNIYETPELLN